MVDYKYFCKEKDNGNMKTLGFLFVTWEGNKSRKISYLLPFASPVTQIFQILCFACHPEIKSDIGIAK